MLVSISDTPKVNCVRFFLTPDTGTLDLNYEHAADMEGGRELSRKLAEVLGYTFTTAEVADTVSGSGAA